jgi:gluconolactonase
MNRLFSLLLVLPIGLYASCASKSADTKASDTAGTDPGAGTPNPDGGAVATPAEIAKNPIEGIAPAKVTLDTGAFTSGPIWSAKEGVLFFTTPLGAGGLYRMRPDGSAMKVRDGNPTNGEIPIGNTIDAAGNLITVEAKRITRGSTAADAGACTPIASGYVDPAGDAGLASFDTLKDAVISANGTLYATDPGYFTAPVANRIFRITAAGKVSVVEAFADVPRPNGVALTPDGKGLYVGFTQPMQGTKPFVRKYLVNADGSLGEHVKFIELDANMEPDGIEVDQAGNLYIATKAGVMVFKSDATSIGVVAVPEQPTATAFGGKDLKTLYITTQGTKIYETTVNVPGVVQ